jgi:hypothetical protein
MVKLGSKLKESILFESELLAMILALTVWQPYVGHCPVLIFIDDNAVRDVVISGKARGGVASKMVGSLLRLEDVASVWPWYS